MNTAVLLHLYLPLPFFPIGARYNRIKVPERSGVYRGYRISKWTITPL